MDVPRSLLASSALSFEIIAERIMIIRIPINVKTKQNKEKYPILPSVRIIISGNNSKRTIAE
jgi:hypothetical protein